MKNMIKIRRDRKFKDGREGMNGRETGKGESN